MADTAGYDAFLAHARAIAARFEQRRQQFLRQLKFRCLVAVVLLVTFPLWYSLLERIDHMGGSAFSSVAWLFIHILAGTIIIAGIIVFAVLPLFRYRHSTVQIGNDLPGVSGMVQQNVSLKGEIYGQLLRHFGEFTLYGERKFLLRSFRDAPDMPEFDEYDNEDYIKGAVSGVGFEMAETELLVQRPQGSMPIFNGLFILLDINDTNLVLHGTFSGKTVVIIDRQQEGGFIAEKYGAFRPIALPDSFRQHVEAFTTDAAEAERLLSADALRNILKLSEAVRHAKNQKRHTDDKVAYAIGHIAKGLSDMLAVAATSLLSWIRTGRLNTRARRHMVTLVETPISADARAFNELVHIAFYDDKLLISIPYRHNLFEPDPISRPPLNDDDIKLVYDVMTTVKGLADSVVSNLPKAMA